MFRTEGKVCRTNKSTVIMTTGMCQTLALQSTGLSQRIVWESPTFRGASSRYSSILEFQLVILVYMYGITIRNSEERRQKTLIFIASEISLQLSSYVANPSVSQLKFKSTQHIHLIVAPCIFVESLQFINQRMHIKFQIKHF